MLLFSRFLRTTHLSRKPVPGSLLLHSHCRYCLPGKVQTAIKSVVLSLISESVHCNRIGFCVTTMFALRNIRSILNRLNFGFLFCRRHTSSRHPYLSFFSFGQVKVATRVHILLKFALHCFKLCTGKTFFCFGQSKSQRHTKSDLCFGVHVSGQSLVSIFCMK